MNEVANIEGKVTVTHYGMSFVLTVEELPQREQYDSDYVTFSVTLDGFEKIGTLRFRVWKDGDTYYSYRQWEGQIFYSPHQHFQPDWEAVLRIMLEEYALAELYTALGGRKK